MNKTKRLLAFLLMLALCCTMTACKKNEGQAANTPVPTATANANDVMVTVGDRAVTRAEFDEYLNSIVTFYSNYGYDVTDPDAVTIMKSIALETAVQYVVMDRQIAERGLALTDEETAATIEQAKADWAGVIADGLSYYGITAESTQEERDAMTLNVLAELESMGYTAEAFEADSLKNAIYNKLFDEVTKDVAVSDEDVVAYYSSLVEADRERFENNVEAYEQAQYMNSLYAAYGMSDYVAPLYYKPAGYRIVTHILLEADEALLDAYTGLQATYEEQQNAIEEGTEVTETLVTPEEIENARLAILANVQPKVDEINRKLAEGKTFAELIPEYTTDPGMMDEAAIAAGYEVHMDSMNYVIAFRDQAFTVNEIGAVTAPVVTDYGVHILQYVADAPSGATELTDEMRADFHESLLADAQSEVYATARDAWLAAVTPVYSAESQAILDAAAALEAAAAAEE